MPLIRHKQRPPTAVSPVKGQGRWINPNKAGRGFPDPDLSIPSVFWQFQGDGQFRSGSTTPLNEFDSTGKWRFSCAFRLTTVGGGSDQVLVGFGDGSSKRVLVIATNGRMAFDDVVQNSFPALVPTANVWFVFQLDGDADTVTGTLINLETPGSVSETVTIAGNVTTSRSRIGASSGAAANAVTGNVARIRWNDEHANTVDGSANAFHWPMDEGAPSTTIFEVLANVQSLAESGTGFFFPEAFQLDWANWVPVGTGFDGANTFEPISATQFTAETGEPIPDNHTGTVLKVTLNEDAAATASATLRLQLGATIAIDNWATLCIRYFIKADDWTKFDVDGEFRLRMVDNVSSAAFTRSLKPTSSFQSHRLMNFAIFDPNDADWLANNDQYGFRIPGQAGQPGSFDNTNVDQWEMVFTPDTAANGFTAPLTFYVLDLLHDIKGTEPGPIHVVIGWDDSNVTDLTEVDVAAATHGIPQVGFFDEGAIDAGGKLTSANVSTLRDSTRWEFAQHAFAHGPTNYETRTAAAVTSDIKAVQAGMLARGLTATPSAVYGSRPENAHRLTNEGAGDNTGVSIADLERAEGRPGSRKGFFGYYSATLGVPNPLKVGSLGALGQDTEQINDAASWQALHNKMLAMGTSYVMYGHKINVAPAGGLEFDPTELDTIFAALATDIGTGAVKVQFFGGWFQAVGSPS